MLLQSNGTKVITTTTTTTTTCMCCYQLKPSEIKRSVVEADEDIVAPTIVSAANNNSNTNSNTNTNTKFGARKFLVVVVVVVIVALLMMLEQGAVMVGAAPQSCVLCDVGDVAASSKVRDVGYEEFLFEHQVTRQDAIAALRGLNYSLHDGPVPEQACKFVSCTKTALKYCLSSQFINDHCWCELGHTDEGLPFIPHICYVGEKSHSPSVGSCFFYEEVKECCCAPILAKQWRHISQAATIMRMPKTLMTSLLILLTITRPGYF